MDRSIGDLNRVTRSHHQEVFERGIELFNEGRFFECHEVWEEIWLRAEGDEKLFLQGMIQAAVAILHAQRGNLDGARSLYAKSSAKIDSMPVVHRGIALGELRDELRRFFEAVMGGGAIPTAPKINRVA
ncbi:MAG: DUF309 domain-containing protein [Candidatus Binatus sp.]|uniref:DUF309 domain-containing protein n=1 Tax=Candidatus Binatus sp. TaxID=2811406 RepID=UPI0027168034|nr:DUF309 domain-containing protein [Candidatus Binatus sp.]MDO8434507.1 DUF309 domain-containing protein [Candidatus Binatus sp.]